MNNLQQHLLYAGKELGVQVIVPFELVLENGHKFLADALLPELGGPKGMIIVQCFDGFEPFVDEAVKMGHGVSTLTSPLDSEIFELKGARSIFMDWGWYSDTKPAPDWMLHYAPCDEDDLG